MKTFYTKKTKKTKQFAIFPNGLFGINRRSFVGPGKGVVDEGA